jgi:opacity protein-like surface antigen
MIDYHCGMKKLLFILLIGCFSLNVNAQEETKPLFYKGITNVYLGYGAGNLSQEFLRDLVSISNEPSIQFSATGPLFVKLEHGFEDKVSLGVNFAYMKNTISYEDQGFTDTSSYVFNADLSCTTLSILARVNYHIGNNPIIDPYVGIGVGYRNVRWTYTDDDPAGRTDIGDFATELLGNFPFGMDLTFGARIMPLPQIGLFAEVGVAKGIIQGGVTASF